DAIVTPAAITGSAAGISSRPFKVPLQHGVHDDVFGFAVPDDGLPLNAFPCEPQLLGQPDRGGVLLRYPQDDPVEAKHLEREAKGPPSGPVGESPSPALGYGNARLGLAVGPVYIEDVDPPHRCPVIQPDDEGVDGPLQAWVLYHHSAKKRPIAEPLLNHGKVLRLQG